MPRLNNLQRGQALGMLQAGRTQEQVAGVFGVARMTICRLWRRFTTTGSVSDAPRSGRPRVTTPREDRYITRTHRLNRFQPATETASSLPNGRQVTSQTIRNRLRSVGVRSRRPFKGPTLTPDHRRRRLDWARTHVNMGIRWWNGVLFSDESRFLLRRVDGRRRVYRRRGERYVDECVERRDAFGGGSLMAWAGISYHHRTNLVFINGNLNAQRYRDEILVRHVRPFIRRHGGRYQHDNARPHVARICRDYLARANIAVIPWPALSSDMAPIEHLWDCLDRRVRRRRQQPQTLNDLRNALNQEWRRIPQATIRRLIRSMNRRCTALIAARGGYTRY